MNGIPEQSAAHTFTPSGMTANHQQHQPIEMHIEIPVSEYSRLSRLVGYWDGVVEGLELVADTELRQAVENAIERHRELLR